VEAMLLMAAGLLKEPAPFVLQKSLGDFAVTYELNAYCDDPQRMAQLCTGCTRISSMFSTSTGVQIMTPAYEGDPESPKVVPKNRWYLSPAKPTDALSKDGYTP
jgi:hypothetical protein